MKEELNLPVRLLMGPGPSDVHPSVLKAMATPLLGHLDPKFLELMNDTMDLLRMVFETKNDMTMSMPGTGSSGMETIFVNLLEPGDKAIVCVNGVFGGRMADVAERCGAEVVKVEAPWGEIIPPEKVKEAIDANKDAKVVAIVHAETSTGVMQPLEEISKLVKANGSLLLVDAVTSLGGAHVNVDKLGIDAVYSGTQKCLSIPPGLAPVSFSDRAVEVLDNRKKKVQSWYLDLTMIRNYWGGERAYHHTAPISMVYALREGLRLIEKEGLDNTVDRHFRNGRALQAGLQAMGMKLVVEKEEERLPMLTSVMIPEGVNDGEVRSKLLNQYDIEIGGGLGDLKGKAWRIGLMGHSCSEKNVMTVLAALENLLTEGGCKVDRGAGLKAAADYLK
ncbi:alanine-glyoxylate transaminase/serine-glyoxylate transaminase/serine-pyruvate transaminase [Desulfitispora alkaliphila]|uniref:pyridoxal-phosphate-dependent aminotransferase family protein n=1 Tax=Desulfitispora alkaliphila TaxID=622674 RepID=UPI003D202037